MRKANFRSLAALLLPAAILLPLGDLPLSAMPPGETPAANPKRLSKKQAVKYCGPRTVDIEVKGRDDKGQWISHAAGTILHEDGYILTCEHVTYPGDSQEVILADGTRYPYKVLARAGGSYDTAILRIEPKEKLPAVNLGHSESVVQDEPVMVIGNPNGRRHTINHGIISKPTCGGGTQIQVSRADIGPGNSGGPVFNNRGEQIAHVHVKIWTVPNTSRHIRVDHTRDAFAKVFADEDRYSRAIGLTVDCQGDEAQVTEVDPDSAAAEADIRKGDVITQLDAMKIEYGPHYVLALMDRLSEEPIAITLRREGQSLKKEVRPRKRQ